MNLRTSGFFHDRFPYSSHHAEVPLFRKLTIAFCISMIISMTSNIIHLCLRRNPVEIVQNGFMLAIGLLVTQICMVSLRITRYIPILVDLKKELWAWDDAEPELKRKITFEIMTLRRIRVVFMIGAAFTAFILPISNDPKEMFGLLYFFESVLAMPWFKHIYYALKAFQMIIAVIFPNPGFMMIYSIGDCTYTIMIVRERMNLIGKTFGEDEKWFYDSAYQEYVETVLKNCIKQHIMVKKYFEIISSSITSSIVFAFMITVSIYSLFYFNVVMHFSNTVLIKSSLIIGVICVSTYKYFELGQSFQDQCEYLYRDLCGCPWYLWNKSNKNLYLSFLIHTREPMVMKSLHISLNNTLAVQITRTTGSLLTTIRQLANI